MADQTNDELTQAIEAAIMKTFGEPYPVLKQNCEWRLYPLFDRLTKERDRYKKALERIEKDDGLHDIWNIATDALMGSQ